MQMQNYFFYYNVSCINTTANKYLLFFYKKTKTITKFEKISKNIQFRKRKKVKFCMNENIDRHDRKTKTTRTNTIFIQNKKLIDSIHKITKKQQQQQRFNDEDGGALYGDTHCINNTKVHGRKKR